MARKLSKEELEKYKTDFDPPQEKQTKQTKKEKAIKESKEKKPTKTEKELAAAAEKKIIKEDKVVKPKLMPVPKHPGGRPGAFLGEVQAITLKLPPADITKLKVMAAQQNKTAAQVIHDLLN